MKMMTITSVTKSDSEWIPSAIMALLRPTTPATILAAESMRLVKNPTQVTRAAFFSRSMSLICSVSFIAKCDKNSANIECFELGYIVLGVIIFNLYLFYIAFCPMRRRKSSRMFQISSLFCKFVEIQTEGIA